MSYEITAISEVEILACPPGGDAGNPRWITLLPGETAVTGALHGVRPRYVPQEFPFTIRGQQVVAMPPEWYRDIPSEIYGLFRVSPARA